MTWVSIKESTPLRDTYILVTDGKMVRPYYTNDLTTLFSDQNPAIFFEDRSKIKVDNITHWMYMPAPKLMEDCHTCMQKYQEWQAFIRENDLKKELESRE